MNVVKQPVPAKQNIQVLTKELLIFVFMNHSNKIDKSAFKIIKTVTDLDDEITYWLHKTPQERLDALEFLRQQYILQHKLPVKMDKTVFGINYGK